MEYVFWFSFLCVFYAYAGYPLVLLVLTPLFKSSERDFPETAAAVSITMIIPVFNEQQVIGAKIDNTLSLDYPPDLFDVIIVSDGSTDQTRDIVRQKTHPSVHFIDLPLRKGKANALNAGQEQARGDVLVFSDASIMLERSALRNIVKRFRDPVIGCVSGEDRIAGASGEGLYGRYELFLRNLESRLYSIVGASGSFYAVRRELAEPFSEGAAPDFLSVLHTVDRGYRAVTEPAAVGIMSAVKSSREELGRKVRTLVRGMTALFRNAHLLSPTRNLLFSFELFSHKLMRWLVPFFLVALLASNAAMYDSFYYRSLFFMQLLFYTVACCSLLPKMKISQTLVGKIPLYFVMVNVAIVIAWYKYLVGFRQELWNPSNR